MNRNRVSLARQRNAGAHNARNGRFEGVPIQPITGGWDTRSSENAFGRRGNFSSKTQVGISVIRLWN